MSLHNSRVGRRFEDDPLTHRIIGAAIEVHRLLGPGLLESAYEECLCYELTGLGLSFERQVLLPLAYKSMRLLRAYKLDLNSVPLRSGIRRLNRSIPSPVPPVSPPPYSLTRPGVCKKKAERLSTLRFF